MGRISLKLTRAFCAISAVLLYSNVALANCPLPDPEKEDIIQYPNGYTAALGPSEAKLPFCLKVSIDGTGYLVDLNGFQAKQGSSANVSSEEYNRSHIWRDLSKTVCEKNWGKLKKLEIEGALPVDFVTFDVPSVRIGEKNIYHLDVVFNEKTWLPFLYRVRGIGINNAKFIQAPKEEMGTSPFSK